MAAIIAAVFGLIEFMVAMRFVFMLFGANPTTPFVNWIYNWSAYLVAPFAGILGQPVVTPSGTVVSGVFDPATLIALVVYGVVGGLLLKFFGGR